MILNTSKNDQFRTNQDSGFSTRATSEPLTYASGEPPLPHYLAQVVRSFTGVKGFSEVVRWLRPPNVCMTPDALGAFKASRVSFSQSLARKMINERWRIELKCFETDQEGESSGWYEIQAGRHNLTFALRSFAWDGIEKVGRRADGPLRDVLGVLFVGKASKDRIKKELATFDAGAENELRTDATVAGWNPANRSVRFFDYTVDSLASGCQPDLAFLASGGGYLLRNGGFQGSGRNGSLSFEGYAADHPLKHPYFADLFGLYMIRQVSIDLVNSLARDRNPQAAQLSPEISKFIGVGNASGQGMCVAMQRWPHWIASWVTTRELCLAYAKSKPVTVETARTDKLVSLISRARRHFELVKLESEEFVTSRSRIASELGIIRNWVEDITQSRDCSETLWGDLVTRCEENFSRETVEQLGSLLIEVFPEFADAVSEYLPIAARLHRDVIPEMEVSTLKEILSLRYDWALRYNLLKDGSRQHFWYHSEDNGEQRRGERIIDPHEEFESFIDHIGAVQHLASTLAEYHNHCPVAEVIADEPDLAFIISRVQYLANVPYSEIRGNLIDREFIPAQLIRFMHSSLGMECASPLSVQYVRGVYFQGMPTPDELALGADPDWLFPSISKLATSETELR